MSVLESNFPLHPSALIWKFLSEEGFMRRRFFEGPNPQVHDSSAVDPLTVEFHCGLTTGGSTLSGMATSGSTVDPTVDLQRINGRSVGLGGSG